MMRLGILFGLVALTACGSPEQFIRLAGDAGASEMDVAAAGGSIGSGGDTGTGGMLLGSGGAATGGNGTGGVATGGASFGGRGVGTGGTVGTGGAATGGIGAGGAATGGKGTGGAATGGMGTGGTAMGGMSTGGTAMGGMGTGGAATGGMGTGGAATGGMGTGGAATGGTSTGGATLTSGILSIDFQGGKTATSTLAMADTEVAGVKPANYWNGAVDHMGSKTGLILSGGLATTASVTWNADPDTKSMGIWQGAFPDADGDARMMLGFLDPVAPATPGVITVSGLPSIAATGYDVYVYCLGDPPSGETRTYGYKIGATTVTVTQAGPAPTTLPKYALATSGGTGNYVVFRKVTGATFTLTATPSTATSTRARAPVNGIQIVWPSGS